MTAISPIVFLILSVVSGSAGGEPVEYIIHYTGVGALNTLVVLLMLSPLARYFKLGALIPLRRPIGLYVFAYATLHILAFLAFDLLFEWSLFLQEVVKRPYIVVGALGYIILIALSVTSFKFIKRKMGKRWQQLHNFVYLVALLVPIHFYWSVKSEIIEPSIYLVLIGLLLSLRIPKTDKILSSISRMKLKWSNS